MKKFDKLAVGTVLIALVASVSLYGVWEDKVILVAPLLTLIYLSLTVWVVAAFRERGWTSSFQTPLGGVWLLLFWLCSAVMIPFAVLPYEAKISTLRFGCYFGTYWASATVLSRFSYRKAVWTVIFTILVFVALYSLVQHRVAPNLIFGMERYTTYWENGRLGGTYQCPNHIAHLFQMWIPFCLVFLFIPQFGWFWRICFTYAIPLFLLLIYQTQSRAGILGTIAALGVTMLLLILRKSRGAFYIALLVIPLLSAVVIGGLWVGSSMFRTRMQPVVKFITHVTSGAVIEEEFNDFRPQTWLDTLEMIKHRPVFGFGPGNYGATYEDYRTRFTGVRVETVHAHNEYLEMTAEYGWVGAALVLCLLISMVAQLIRFICASPHSHHALPAAALLGVLAGTAVHGFFDFELRIFPNAMMMALLAGCTVAPLVRQKSEIENQKSTGHVWVPILWLLASVFLLLSAIWSVQVMSSAWIRTRGDQLLLKQKFQQAERLYTTAEQIDPQNWLAYWGFGQVYYQYRYYELDPIRKHEWALKEKTAYTDAYRINSKKEEVVYGLGRVDLFLGDREAGLNYLRQAANYKRFNDFYWRKLGIELRKAGLYNEALKSFEYAQKLDRSNTTVKRNIQWIKVRMKP